MAGKKGGLIRKMLDRIDAKLKEKSEKTCCCSSEKEKKSKCCE